MTLASRLLLALLVLCGGLGALPAMAAAPTVAGLSPTVITLGRGKLEMQGKMLTEAQAQDLETKLVADPDDLTTRTLLLGYYEMRRFRPGKDRELRAGHVLWFIEHHPDADILPPFLGLDQAAERVIIR